MGACDQGITLIRAKSFSATHSPMHTHSVGGRTADQTTRSSVGFSVQRHFKIWAGKVATKPATLWLKGQPLYLCNAVALILPKSNKTNPNHSKSNRNSLSTCCFFFLLYLLVRSTRDSEDEDDEDRRGRSCSLQYQHAIVKVLTHFVAESADSQGQTSFLLGSDWQVDITEMVWDFLKVVNPQIAKLLDRRILVGVDIGVTVIQVCHTIHVRNY